MRVSEGWVDSVGGSTREFNSGGGVQLGGSPTRGGSNSRGSTRVLQHRGVPCPAPGQAALLFGLPPQRFDLTPEPLGATDGSFGLLAAHYAGCAYVRRTSSLERHFGSPSATFDEHRCSRHGMLRRVRVCHPWTLAAARGSGQGGGGRYGEGDQAVLQHRSPLTGAGTSKSCVAARGDPHQYLCSGLSIRLDLPRPFELRSCSGSSVSDALPAPLGRFPLARTRPNLAKVSEGSVFQAFRA